MTSATRWGIGLQGIQGHRSQGGRKALFRQVLDKMGFATGGVYQQCRDWERFLCRQRIEILHKARAIAIQIESVFKLNKCGLQFFGGWWLTE